MHSQLAQAAFYGRRAYTALKVKSVGSSSSSSPVYMYGIQKRVSSDICQSQDEESWEEGT